MKQCRDCSALLSDTRPVLCPGCRALTAKKRMAPVKPLPHPCLTKGCQSLLEGKSLYCPACLYRRHLVQQRRYRNRVKVMHEDLPPEPVTNLDWLKNFSAWAESGLSYAEYQKAEWMKSPHKG